MGCIGSDSTFIRIEGSPVLLYDSKGSLGYLTINIIGVAAAAIVLIAALFSVAEVAVLLTGIAVIICYLAVTRYEPGGWGGLQAHAAFMWAGIS